MEVEYDNMFKKVDGMYSFFPPVKEQIHHVNIKVKRQKNRKSKGKSLKNKKKEISKNGKNKQE